MTESIIDVNYEINEANGELEDKSTEQLCHEAMDYINRWRQLETLHS